MSIEFQCTQCRLRLRTPDDTAGKQAKCPQCGTLIDIPSDHDAALPATGAAPIPTTGPDFAAAASPPNPYAAPPRLDPYQTTPAARGGVVLSSAELKGKVQGPAIGMLVGAVLSIVYTVCNIVASLVLGLEEMGVDLPDGNPAERTLVYIAMLVTFAFMLLVPLGVLVGAVSLLRIKSYSIAMAGAILALMPCGPCCVINLPFGIWALVVLNDVNVRAAFP